MLPLLAPDELNRRLLSSAGRFLRPPFPSLAANETGRVV